MSFNLPNIPGLPKLELPEINLGALPEIPNPLPYLLDYKLTETSLQIIALNGQFTLREFPYKEMIAVKKGYEIFNEHWENRLDLWNSAVSIRLDRAVLPWLVVTPANTDDFVRDLSGRIGRSRA